MWPHPQLHVPTIQETCLQTNVAHPLDEYYQGREDGKIAAGGWAAVPLTNFDGDFKAKGVVKVKMQGGKTEVAQGHFVRCDRD